MKVISRIDVSSPAKARNLALLAGALLLYGVGMAAAAGKALLEHAEAGGAVIGSGSASAETAADDGSDSGELK